MFLINLYNSDLDDMNEILFVANMKEIILVYISNDERLQLTSNFKLELDLIFLTKNRHKINIYSFRYLHVQIK